MLIFIFDFCGILWGLLKSKLKVHLIFSSKLSLLVMKIELLTCKLSSGYNFINNIFRTFSDG